MVRKWFSRPRPMNLEPAMVGFRVRDLENDPRRKSADEVTKRVQRDAVIVESIPGEKSSIRLARAVSEPSISSTMIEVGKKP